MNAIAGVTLPHRDMLRSLERMQEPRTGRRKPATVEPGSPPQEELG